MRSLLFVLTFAFTAMASASSALNGTVVRKGQQVYLQGSGTCDLLLATTRNQDATAALQKLSDGDHVTATGTVDEASCTAAIENIDYVGLRRLLGKWYSKEGLIEVHDFTRMSFYPVRDSIISANFAAITPVQYKYSVTPSEGKEWVLFLSDRMTTTFATIQFSKELAIMKLFDSDNGKITKVLILNKRGTLK